MGAAEIKRAKAMLAEARRIARTCLRRRNSAPRRIGVAYRSLSLFDPHGWAEATGVAAAAEAG